MEPETLKDKITPELKSKFLVAIGKTMETGKEHGFFLCRDEKGNLSAPKIKSGIIHGLDLGSPIVECTGKKVQGHFHTHSYLTAFKKTSRLMKPGMRNEDVKRFINDEYEKYKKELDIKELSIDSPSSKDLLKAILESCSGISKGTTCVASDMGNYKSECWTPKELSENECIIAHNKLYDDGKERKAVLYDKHMITLFDKEDIDLTKK